MRAHDPGDGTRFGLRKHGGQPEKKSLFLRRILASEGSLQVSQTIACQQDERVIARVRILKVTGKALMKSLFISDSRARFLRPM